MRRARLAAAILVPFVVAALPLAAWTQFRPAPDTLRVVVAVPQPPAQTTVSEEEPASTARSVGGAMAEALTGLACGGPS
ncbi:hypothetical protein HRbin29_01072 [bacterium HR29]|jgi:hypothetical protein|nr:hypothetical protein HRbin29_01072 [bacterium HR29]